jgi:hypothetical protein
MIYKLHEVFKSAVNRSYVVLLDVKSCWDHR